MPVKKRYSGGGVHRMTKLTRSALVVLVLAAPALAAGKTESAKDWASLAGCSPASEIRVTLAGGARVRGAFVSASADSLVIRTAKGERALARREVQRAEVQGAGRRFRHALIGMAVGAGGGGVIAAAAHAQKCTGFCVGPDINHIVTVASVPAGAVLGALAGAVLPAGGWKEVYRAQP
jgi:hypothetical protein